MNWQLRCCAAAALVAVCAAGRPCAAVSAVGPAVSLSGGFELFPAAGTIHGWEFTLTRPITVTHLGLFDLGSDGFELPHPIGLFRLGDGTLLAGGAMSPGVGDFLVDNFRYVDVPDANLSMGERYVVSYFTATDYFLMTDHLIVQADNLQVSPAISITQARWEFAGLGIPQNVVAIDDRFGPNFLFVVPEPGTAGMAAWGATAVTAPVVNGFQRGRKRAGGRD
jgi:hypothetical protein